MRSSIAQRTDAFEAVDQIDAFASIGARAAAAFIHIELAKLSGETWRAGAVVLSDEVDTSGAVEAVVPVAIVDIQLALAARKARYAAATVITRSVLAAQGVAAQFRNTALVHIYIYLHKTCTVNNLFLEKSKG